MCGWSVNFWGDSLRPGACASFALAGDLASQLTSADGPTPLDECFVAVSEVGWGLALSIHGRAFRGVGRNGDAVAARISVDAC